MIDKCRNIALKLEKEKEEEIRGFYDMISCLTFT